MSPQAREHNLGDRRRYYSLLDVQTGSDIWGVSFKAYVIIVYSYIKILALTLNFAFPHFILLLLVGIPIPEQRRLMASRTLTARGISCTAEL